MKKSKKSNTPISKGEIIRAVKIATISCDLMRDLISMTENRRQSLRNIDILNYLILPGIPLFANQGKQRELYTVFGHDKEGMIYETYSNEQMGQFYTLADEYEGLMRRYGKVLKDRFPVFAGKITGLFQKINPYLEVCHIEGNSAWWQSRWEDEIIPEFERLFADMAYSEDVPRGTLEFSGEVCATGEMYPKGASVNIISGDPDSSLIIGKLKYWFAARSANIVNALLAAFHNGDGWIRPKDISNMKSGQKWQNNITGNIGDILEHEKTASGRGYTGRVRINPALFLTQ